MIGRERIAIVVAEFLSSTALAMVALAMVGRTNFPFFLAAAMGMSAAMLAYVLGAHTNPVISLAQWTMRRLDTVQAVMRMAAQMLGGVAAWQLSQYLVNAELNNIAGTTFDWRVLVAEALGALVLGMGVAAAVSRAYDASRQAVVVGGAWALGVLLASLASNGLLSPAVAVGVQSWSWAYALGPVIGAVAGATAYELVFTERAVVTAKPAATRVTKRKTTAKKPAAKKPATRKRK